MNRALQIAIAHPFLTASSAMLIVVALTFAYTLLDDGWADEQISASQYDKHFTYEQLQMMEHFAMCDAMLFSTRPDEELDNVKERIAVDVEYLGDDASDGEAQYRRRIRTRQEIAEVVRLAEEFYERVNCK